SPAINRPPRTKPPTWAQDATPGSRAPLERPLSSCIANHTPSRTQAGTVTIQKKMDDPDKAMYIGAGIHDQIRAEHAGDGAARANHRHLRGRVGAGLDQRCGGAATKVDQQIPEAAQQILDIVPENPQEQHIAAEMQPSAMQEHAGEDRRPGW